MTNGVEVAESSLVRAWRREGGGEFWIQLTTPSDNLDTFGAAIDIPSEAQEGVISRLAGTVPGGFVALIEGAHDKAHLLAWAHTVAQRLDAAGVTGTLAAARPAGLPRWLDTIEPPQPGAFITWSFDAEHSTSDPTQTAPLWKLDADTTRAVIELCTDFVTATGPRTRMRQGAFSFEISDQDAIADMVATAIVTDGIQAGVICHNDPGRTLRSASLICAAETALQEISPRSWQERIGALTDAICARPDLLDYAIIRHTSLVPGGWRSTEALLRLPHTPNRFRYCQHLATRYVIDAHGVQVLTSRQLAGLRNPDHWNTRDLGHDRHLVTAPDLAPWYATLYPDPDTLAAARDDFTDILLTPDIIDAHPPPWRTT